MTTRAWVLLLLFPSVGSANLQFAGHVSVCNARGEPTEEVLGDVWVTGFYGARNAEDRGRNTTTDAEGYFYLDGAYNGNEQYCYRRNGFQCEVRFEKPGYEPTVYRDRWYNDNNNTDLRHFTDDQDLGVQAGCLDAEAGEPLPRASEQLRQDHASSSAALRASVSNHPATPSRRSVRSPSMIFSRL